MTPIPTLIDRNRAFAEGAHVHRPMLPTLNTLVVSCLDARTDPAHFLGLEPGEALVVRNAGGRMTAETEEQLAMLIVLAGAMGAPLPEVVLVHHTECGMQKLADPQLRGKISHAASIPTETLEGLAIHDHRDSLATDLARLNASARIPAGIRVTGLLFDAHTGQVETVFEEVTR